MNIEAAEKANQVPRRPDGVQSNAGRLTENFIQVKGGYNYGQKHILATSVDSVEMQINFETYERMEHDPTITKAKKIIVTNVLTDEMQFSPGATEKEVAEAEYNNFIEIMEFCQRLFGGFRPYRQIIEQLLGNAIRYGHGLGEIEWAYRLDKPFERPVEETAADKAAKKSGQQTTKPPKQGAFARLMTRIGLFSPPAVKAADAENDPAVVKRRTAETLRLMIDDIKVKPRGTFQFAIDSYFNLLGIVPRVRTTDSKLRYDEIIDRRKFVLLTLNKQDEDPRGRSFYRPLFNYYNLKTQIPAEMLRFVLNEINPKVVGKLPPNAQPFEYLLDERNQPVTDENGQHIAIPVVESFRNQIAQLNSGVGVIIPNEAELTALKSVAGDATIFQIILNVIERQMENALLLQNLAQSEGEHQARSASATHKELLEAMTFMLRWILAVMTLNDICKQAVILNYGEAFVKYLPFISFGDFVRRDWARDLEVIAKAYYYGFIDDTQRAELCAWLNLPDPGPSRAEIDAELLAVDDGNGEPGMVNNKRADKQRGNKGRKRGNTTEDNNDTKSITGRGPINNVGYHGKWTVGVAGTIRSDNR